MKGKKEEGLKTLSYVLGISAYYHDSSACLVKGSEIIAAAAEERFTRKKHDSSFPQNSVRYCLEEAGITLEQVKAVVFYEKPFLTFERLFETYLTHAPFGFPSFALSFPVWAKEKIFMKSQLNNELLKMSKGAKEKLPELLFSAHHLSHAASAFYPSPFKSAAVLCMDGVGEWATTTIWHGDGKDLELKKQINFPDSIGLLYSAFTYYCGFKVNDGEYKLMGLAPYGDPIFADKIKEQLIQINSDGSYKINMTYFDYATGLRMTNKKFDKLFGGPPRQPESELTQREMDLAASVQFVLEEVILKLARYAKQITGESHICLSGGVALNCVANGKLVESGELEGLWIQPAASDSGGALGAALSATHKFYESKREVNLNDQMKGCYLGPSYSDVDIEKKLKDYGATYKKLSEEEILEIVSSQILEDKVIGWFQGRSEFGPRALGNRSILGNATSPELQKIINLKIKYRESFRPFAPSMLLEEVEKYFSHVKRSPYMLLVDKLKSEYLKELTDEQRNLKGLDRLKVARSQLPAITHVDCSARIQSVEEKDQPKYFKLISKVKNKSGIGVIINTSFNVRNEPIVNSPDDAYRCFMKTEMDTLVLGDFYLEKELQKNFEEKIEVAMPDRMNKKELLKFWSKAYLFILILSYITLPFLGLKKTPYPAVVGLLPIILTYCFNRVGSLFTVSLIGILKEIEGLINKILLGVLYYVLLTPYSFLMRLFIKKENKEKSSYWLEPENIMVNERLY